MVLEVPIGIAGQPKQFSKQEAGQEWDAGAHNFAHVSFLSSEEEKSYDFPGWERNWQYLLTWH